MKNFFSDPLKLIPLAICAIALVGEFVSHWPLADVVTLLAAAGVLHPAISAVSNNRGQK